MRVQPIGYVRNMREAGRHAARSVEIEAIVRAVRLHVAKLRVQARLASVAAVNAFDTIY